MTTPTNSPSVVAVTDQLGTTFYSLSNAIVMVLYNQYLVAFQTRYSKIIRLISWFCVVVDIIVVLADLVLMNLRFATMEQYNMINTYTFVMNIFSYVVQPVLFTFTLSMTFVFDFRITALITRSQQRKLQALLFLLSLLQVLTFISFVLFNFSPDNGVGEIYTTLISENHEPIDTLGRWVNVIFESIDTVLCAILVFMFNTFQSQTEQTYDVPENRIIETSFIHEIED